MHGLINGTAVVMGIAIVLAFGASAQAPAPALRAGTAEWYFQRIPAEAPTDFVGQQYVQAFPAAGREDMHAELEGKMSLAGDCSAVGDPRASIAERIVALARSTQVVIINEAHDVPSGAARTSLAEQVARREEGQAENLIERIFERDREAKVIVQVGYSHALVEARFRDEPPEAIPVDRLLLWPGESIPLVLPPGNFRITVHEEGGPRHDFVVGVEE